MGSIQSMVFGVMAVLLVQGCATARYFTREAPKNAEQLYANGVQDLKDELFPEAIKEFTDLKVKYPYTRFVALADLRIADTHHARGKFIEAIDAYRMFIKYHPQHEEAPYAMLQMGEVYFAQLATDWFLLPPVAEKDQGNTRLALTAYRDMIARYPNHKLAASAKTQMAACRIRLLEHELYVARFYLKRKQWVAVAQRAEYALKKYTGLGQNEEILWLAGLSRFNMGDHPKAAVHLNSLGALFPKSSWRQQANALLGQIASTPPKDATHTHGENRGPT